VTQPAGTQPRFFAASSIWNYQLPVTAPLDPDSASIVARLAGDAGQLPLSLAATTCGAPIYTVAADTPTVHVTLDTPSQPVLQASLNQVPIPAGALVSKCSDENLSVYQPSTDTMWEFWRMQLEADGWHAAWGGKMQHVSTDPGYYRNVLDASGNLIERYNWGATAASFPLVAGVATISELEKGVIPHALALEIKYTCAGVWSWPAQRSDGNDLGQPCIPEGAHFRLDPNLDLASLHLPRLVNMLAVAAQKYGIVIINKTSGFAFRMEDPQQFQQAYGYDPYFGPQHQPGTPGALMDNWPSIELALFPWSHLQLLPMDLRTQPDLTTVSATP
jgi:hypothetical protein